MGPLERGWRGGIEVFSLWKVKFPLARTSMCILFDSTTVAISGLFHNPSY